MAGCGTPGTNARHNDLHIFGDVQFFRSMCFDVHIVPTFLVIHAIQHCALTGGFDLLRTFPGRLTPLYQEIFRAGHGCCNSHSAGTIGGGLNGEVKVGRGDGEVVGGVGAGEEGQHGEGEEGEFHRKIKLGIFFSTSSAQNKVAAIFVKVIPQNAGIRIPGNFAEALAVVDVVRPSDPLNEAKYLLIDFLQRQSVLCFRRM
jgi:hypothetical protein